MIRHLVQAVAVLASVTATRAQCASPVPESSPPASSVSDRQHARQDVRGHWLGVLTAGAQSVRLGLSIEGVEGGPLSARLTQFDPKFTERSVATISLEGAMLRLSINKPAVTYTATLEDDPARLVGMWRQRGVDYFLAFERVEALPGARRPQEPERPLPYRESDVRITAGDSIHLEGTLTLPNEPGRHPVVVLISGSGAQDRDESAFGHRPFLVLSDMLTKRGFGVLRLDDRGVGGSTGDVYQATLDDLAGDVVAAAEYLAGRPDIDPSRISLVGHSQGGLVALLAAAKSAHIARVAMLATPMIPTRDLRSLQTESIGRSMDASDAAINAIRAFNTTVFDAVESGQQGEMLQSTLTDAGRALLVAIPEAERSQYASLVHELMSTASGYATPWFRSLLNIDPGQSLHRVDRPVLLVLGGKDVQVDAETSRRAAEASMPPSMMGRSRTVVLPTVNHMLQTSRTGTLREYVLIDETIAPEVFETLANWLDTE